MSALAKWFNKNNYFVAGYDRTPSALTQELEDEGIIVHYDDNPDNIPDQILANKPTSLVVYTPAVPSAQKEFNFLINKGYTTRKRSEVLGIVISKFYTVAVAGTHGKTTTASMIAHMLKHSGRDIVAFMGGIATNYGSNFILNESTGSEVVAVVEADEFDRSFLKLNPDMAVVTSVDADHLDIYGDIATLEDSFREFIKKIRANGKLFINEIIADELAGGFSGAVCTYGLNRGQFFASNITMNDGFFEFDYSDEQYKIEGLKLGVPGFHNVENATVAIAIGLDLNLSKEEIRSGLESYKGVKRRFEYVLRTDNIVFVDDYAHHPVEITAFLNSLKALYPDKKKTVIFQPHLYTRTRDFAVGFAESLSLADEVILLDIYAAREEPIEGVTADIIYDKIPFQKKAKCVKETLLDCLTARELEVVATIGAGDISGLVAPIRDYLKERYYA